MPIFNFCRRVWVSASTRLEPAVQRTNLERQKLCVARGFRQVKLALHGGGNGVIGLFALSLLAVLLLALASTIRCDALLLRCFIASVEQEVLR